MTESESGSTGEPPDSGPGGTCPLPGVPTQDGHQLGGEVPGVLEFVAATSGSTNLHASPATRDIPALHTYPSTRIAGLRGVQAIDSAPVLQSWSDEPSERFAERTAGPPSRLSPPRASATREP
ncbi:hypothetical protein GCM10009665_26410 [Kitasatospora nipponensis]|uniref:Uncharacterized protein n=1 Tax=Kitasatospora nipponensis TaxID=258049 RepID=A0ABN1W7P6_9ACTN